QLIFLGIDVVRNHEDVVFVAQAFAECLNERSLSGSNRTANPDAQGSRHDRNSLVYCVSCDMDARSTITEADPSSLMLEVMACSLASSTASSSSPIARCPSV